MDSPDSSPHYMGNAHIPSCFCHRIVIIAGHTKKNSYGKPPAVFLHCVDALVDLRILATDSLQVRYAAGRKAGGTFFPSAWQPS
jgi:hypothetical protein